MTELQHSAAAPAIMQIEDLALTFNLPRSLVDMAMRRPGRAVRALNGISLELRKGETLGVVGESGCGKSTLARCMVRLYEPQRGKISFHGDDIFEKNRRKGRMFNRLVQMMFQDPYSSLNPRMTCGQILSEALQVHKMRPADDIPARVCELLDLVRLPQDAAHKLPHEFSGGQRQRIAIARALAVEPEVLIADELVSALDVSVQAQVVNLLLELQDRLGLTILFVAHDLRLVRHVSHRVAVIYLGRIVEIGDSERLFSNPQHPYSQALLSAAPSLDPDDKGQAIHLEGELPSPLNIPKGCPFHVRCRHATDICKRDVPQLRPLGGAGEVACHLAEEINSHA
ncbi:ATP-binding cassette domain-containing protein [Epibacterium sp. DP7N7-1]|jgi:oligopeptide transport system ATP-binding protein|uniref:ABC transporter ATP-binding protein n=1 Tax=Tritonibacter mobilis TaxID=379347 RepID=UPI00080690AD|nr:oligopeptide/dipeptide ABC transporter ATP-binding protein [Tritonibacter mobilis]MBW3243759.1 ATP-binding cassette domain-containing protein [Epibacterium sp. DP7N7-1]MCA2009737.1 ATP-binding cassette domain-containing protein [Tritonibacter mobilis]NKX29834.1 ATP-binding cassette domain-containing protein [Rhodobacteraceae bacterium R_SAG6]